MGLPGLTQHRKFRRLERLLGSAMLARGSLELIWDAAYAASDDLLGDSTDVEAAARWDGDEGALTRALLQAGFIDEPQAGRFIVHDLYEHAPEYVKKRLDRKAAMQAAGKTLSAVRAEAARKRWGSTGEPNSSKRDASGSHLHPEADQTAADGTLLTSPAQPSIAAAARAVREPPADELPAEGGGEAASPPAQLPAPSSPEELPERRLEVVPVVQGAHELGGELRRRLARGRGAPLLPLRDEAAADRLEAQLERLGPQGVQRAEAACRERERTWRGDEVASMAFFAAVVHDLEPVGESETPTKLRDRALVNAAEACPLWGELARTAAEHMAPEFFLRFVAPVEASFDGEVLRLNGTTLESATWVGQQGPAIADGATRRNGDRRVLVHVEPVQARTAGGRP